MLPLAARQMNMEASNKEGWVSGLAHVVMKRRRENGIELAVAFPAPQSLCSEPHEICSISVTTENGELPCYGFYEDTLHADRYDEKLEKRLRAILDAYQPDIVHCFGTEYPHTLAMCRVFERKERLLIGIQGLCAVYANAFFADMPPKAINKVTFRDWLKKDSMRDQQKNFVRRGAMEMEAIGIAGNVTGRTQWDRHYTRKWNKNARYFSMNETLRPEFYESRWNPEDCRKHSIFLSQGDYPIKGLHYMLTALPAVREKYPDVRIYVAGPDLTKYGTVMEKIKISGYGQYLRRLIRDNDLKEQVFFTGRLNARQMRDQYLKSHLFVCPSSIENSPNSLGEAMLLGMPCVSADVGGISSIFTHGKDGILYQGFRTPDNDYDNMENLKTEDEEQLECTSKRLAQSILEMWDNLPKMDEYCKNARNHAEKTHNRESNYKKLTEIYSGLMI